MSERFFDRTILNSPYEYPSRHRELDESGQPTSRILDHRRRVSFITPIPSPKKHGQRTLVFGAAAQALEAEGYMRTYWVPGVNGLHTCGRRDFVEFDDVYTMQADIAATVGAEFARLVEGVVAASRAA